MTDQVRNELKEGGRAPAFTATTEGGKQISLKSLKGRYVVLYFYPRDNTPGCTKEACAFRDAHAGFLKKNAVVLGVSTDSVPSHDRFIEKFNLPFSLLADEDREIAEAYGVWGEKTFMGRKSMGVRRMTFLIGPSGKILRIWKKVKPVEHAAEVLEVLDSFDTEGQ